MTKEQLEGFLDRHGSNPARWPASERVTVEQLITTDSEASVAYDAARRLDAALRSKMQGPQVDNASLARVLAGLAPLPRQKSPFWRLPVVLLDWKFAPAWPRVAALACCAALGFVVGISGFDRRIDQLDGAAVVANQVDLGSVVFEPEPLTGARP